MTRRIATALAIGLAVLLWAFVLVAIQLRAAPTAPQTFQAERCDNRGPMVRGFGETHRLVGAGLNHAVTVVVEHWVSRADPAEWALVIADDTGRSCVMATGRQWIVP